MADAEEKSKAEKLAAAKKRVCVSRTAWTSQRALISQNWLTLIQVEQLKKQKEKAKKAGSKKEEKVEPATEPSKTDEKLEPEPEPSQNANGENPKEDESKDEEETVPELASSPSHHRQPSLTLQSKMRSSSFRQASISGGPLSPNPFSPEGDTAPDIYRKQALRIEDLEKENKRLAKEAADGEKRWKKAEEELEDFREAEGDAIANGNERSVGSAGELQELVWLMCDYIGRY